MEARNATETVDDLSALAWVHDELRRSMESAQKLLRRHLRDADAPGGLGLARVDAALLRQAVVLVHQCVGVLELVGLQMPAAMLRATEHALQRCVGEPQRLNAAAADTVERASFALFDYLARLLGGKPVSPLALFPQYRELQQLAGAARVHPADLWPGPWRRWRRATLPADPSATPQAADAAVLASIEGQTLALMRDPLGPAAARLSQLFADLGAGAQGQPVALLWRMAAAFFEGQSRGLVQPNVYAKRTPSRLLAQLRAGSRDDAASVEAMDRLAQELLFFCAQAAGGTDGSATPRLAAVQRGFALGEHAPVDYEASRLGRFDPAWVAQARKRVAAAKDAWSAVAGAELLRLAGLVELFSQLGDSLRRLYPRGEMLADALQAAVEQTVGSAEAPQAELAMEVATSVLYLDASLEDAEFDHPEQGQRVQRLAQRINAARRAMPPEPLEPWMEELYRRVSDRQTMGSVVQELRASLSETEKQIDLYFRNPAERSLLIPVPQRLQSMRGVLSVLGLGHASQAVLRMRDDVDTLASSDVDPMHAAQAGTFDRLAANLGTLGFMVDMLSVQPQMAKSLFVFDALSGSLRSVVGGGHRAPQFADTTTELTLGGAQAAQSEQARLVEHVQSLALAAVHPEVSLDTVARDLDRLSHEAMAAEHSELAEAANTAQAALHRAHGDAAQRAVREELAQAMADFVATSTEPLPRPERAAAAPAPALQAMQPLLEVRLDWDGDPEMREIFLEEAREVMQAARDALASLNDVPASTEALGTLRRALHTLKGSSRMVGLTDFGEAAWACEQLYNARLDAGAPADAALLAVTHDALAYLEDWIGAIAEGRSAGHDPQAVRGLADSLRLEGVRSTLALPGAAAPAAAEPEGHHAPELPVDLDLDFGVDHSLGGRLPVGEISLTERFNVLPKNSFELSERIDLDLHELAQSAAAEPVAVAAQLHVDSPSLAEVDFELAFEPVAATQPVGEVTFDLDLSALDAGDAEPALSPGLSAQPAVAAEPTIEAAEPSEPFATQETDADAFRQVGPLRIGIALFNIFLNEADELSRRLCTELAEWALELHRPVGESAIALAHSLAGNSATVGFSDLSQLARALEQALSRSNAIGSGTPDEARLFVDAAEEIRRLLHQFAAGFLKPAPAQLMQWLLDHERDLAERLQALASQPSAPDLRDTASDEAISAFGELGHVELHDLGSLPEPATALHARADAIDAEDGIDVEDAVDAELFPIFEEEGLELLPQLAARMRAWADAAADPAGAAACMRTLHTLKGGARLAGAMRLGEMAHRLETAIEHLLARDDVDTARIETLHTRVDAMMAEFDTLRSRDAHAVQARAPAPVPVGPASQEPVVHEPATVLPVAEPVQPIPLEQLVAAAAEAPAADAAEPQVAAQVAPQIDWGRLREGSSLAAAALPQPAASSAEMVNASAVRVRAPLLDRLVNQAGEVSIARARIDVDVVQLKGSLNDLSDNLERLRRQLRELELQGETQISSRLEAAKAASLSFDPLEMDRYTRFQELTRMMAESVNDVATVQRTLQRALQSAEDQLAAQARLTRELQDDLLRTRMVEFEGLSDRLYRVVRQAARETGKHVRLDIVGGSIEVDRGVLDRMTGAFEHLLRNCVTHGIETPEARVALGKDTTGQITVVAVQDGNEVTVEFRDDGSGLNLQRIRERGIAHGLLAPDAQPSDTELANLIFASGFSTAERVTELAGRGIGMDVVRSEVVAMGGRIETATASGQGTSFKLVLPLTTAVTRVVMLRCGDTTVAVPATLVEVVKRTTAQELEQAYASGGFPVSDKVLPFFWLGALLHTSARGHAGRRMVPLVVVRSAQQRVVVHVDEVLGNQEVVVKNLGGQMSRLPGLAGMTLLASGAPTLIYNPVALAALYGEAAWAYTGAARAPGAAEQAHAAQQPALQLAPLVMVVDDSLTVRRITQRLLVREGYRVSLAKDGLDALERLAEERPALVLSDIEMPRMDGFDLVRNLRADERWRDLPVIMITSRIAQKHRDVAAELGVDHYLGKPYSEEQLLGLVARYTAAPVPA